MIARTWRGWTRPEDAEAYAAYVRETGITADTSTPGNLGAHVVTCADGDLTEIMTISFWESLEAITGFAGDNIEQAVFYPEDDRYLVRRETTVLHYVEH